MTRPLSKLIALFLAWLEKHRQAKTLDGYRRYLDRFAAACGDVPLGSLKPHDLLSWGKTWHEIQAVQRLFSWAVNDAGLIEKNPFARIKRPRLGARKRVLEPAQLARLMRAAAPAFRAFLLAMRETLARPQEIRALQWEELRPLRRVTRPAEACAAGEAVFVLADFKARERRADPDAERILLITPRLGRFLARQTRGFLIPSGHVFLNSRGKPWTANAVRCQMRALRRRLGLAPDHRGENVTAYTLRHTRATEATAAGVTDRALADLLGHTTTKTTARYQHLQLEHLREAMGRLVKRKRVGA